MEELCISIDNFPRESSPYPLNASGDLVVFQGSGNRTGELVFILLPSMSRGIIHDIISSAPFSLHSIHQVGASFRQLVD
jgi:hypothetical protein